MNGSIIGVLTAIAIFVLVSISNAQPPVKPILTLGAAKKIVAAAEAEAVKRGSTVVIVVVDDGGHVLLLERLDDTQVASVEVGIGKARTAAIFRRPSKVFEDQIRNGRVAALALAERLPFRAASPSILREKLLGRSASAAMHLRKTKT